MYGHDSTTIKHRCNTCNRLTSSPVKCNNCWEVEIRIGEYLQSKKGRQLVRSILDNYDDDDDVIKAS